MLDTLIKNALIVDGTGAAPHAADVGIQGGRIAQIGAITESAKENFNADGAYLTPGFIDIHTHYDGQATWDDTLAPSCLHGTTTVVMGNCGVGFAPVRVGESQRLLQLMEGVEEIPGAVLAEGLMWNWGSFESYLDVIDATQRSINVACLVPHDCLRYFVMGERAAQLEHATAADIAQMQMLLRNALTAGAIGFSTGRTDNHRTTLGAHTPAAIAAQAELTVLAAALQGLHHRVLHAVNDFDCAQHTDPAAQRAAFDAEYALMEAMARAADRPLALTWLDRLNASGQWQWLGEAAKRSASQGLNIKLQTAPRPIGVLNGLDTSFCVLTPFPSYQTIAHLPPKERAAKLREAATRSAILNETPMRLSGGASAVPPIVDQIIATLDQTAMLMFALDADERDNVRYAPDPRTSFGAQAKARGVRALEVIYDYLSQGDGTRLVYFPIFNYLRGQLDSVGEMLMHPQALVSLGDAGAHVGTICDASNTTTLLTHWVRDQNRMSFEHAIHMLTQRNAQHLGLASRGTIAVGKVADLNVIDLDTLAALPPKVVRDLPAGGRRMMQTARGYLGTWVDGECIQRSGDLTVNRPGRLLRAD